jgi:hypothetical protein
MDAERSLSAEGPTWSERYDNGSAKTTEKTPQKAQSGTKISKSKNRIAKTLPLEPDDEDDSDEPDDAEEATEDAEDSMIDSRRKAPSFAQSRAERERWNAKKARMEYLKAKGELVPIVEITVEIQKHIAAAKTHIMGIKSRIKGTAPGISPEILLVIDKVCTEALNELAEYDPSTTGN